MNGPSGISRLLKILFLLFIIFFGDIKHSIAQSGDVMISFDAPATHFTQSLPVGNGRLGAMLYGDTQIERIALNEISLWSGGPQDADNDSAHFYLKPIQDFLLQGKNKEAQALLQQHFVSKGVGSGYGRGANEKYGAYQTFGDLLIDWRDDDTVIRNYQRHLNVEKAIATTTYLRGENLITEEMFADYVNDVIWLRFKSARKGGLNFHATLKRREHATIRVKTMR